MFFFVSCCPLDEEAFEFDEEHKALLAPYEIGDTLYFGNQEGADMDTFFISGFDTTKECAGGLLSAPSYINISIQIKHLPKNKWDGGEYYSDDGDYWVYDQTLISVVKKDLEKSPTYSINFGFREFTSHEDSAYEEKVNSFFNELNVDKCLKIPINPRKKIEKGDVNVIYWTNKYGLTAYRKEEGGLYKIIPERSD